MFIYLITICPHRMLNQLDFFQSSQRRHVLVISIMLWHKQLVYFVYNQSCSVSIMLKSKIEFDNKQKLA